MVGDSGNEENLGMHTWAARETSRRTPQTDFVNGVRDLLGDELPIFIADYRNSLLRKINDLHEESIAGNKNSDRQTWETRKTARQSPDINFAKEVKKLLLNEMKDFSSHALRRRLAAQITGLHEKSNGKEDIQLA